MKSYSGIRKRLGTRGAINYLKDYHCGRINIIDGTWDEALRMLWDCSVEEEEVAAHARFMDSCGADFIRYKRFNRR